MYEPIFYNVKADIKGGKKYPNINVINIANDRDLDIVKQEIRSKIGF